MKASYIIKIIEVVILLEFISLSYYKIKDALEGGSGINCPVKNHKVYVMSDLEFKIVDYNSRFLPNLLGLKEFFEKLDSLQSAIENAAMANDPDGKMNAHQRRLGKKKCLEATRKLFSFEIEMSKCESFEGIFELTERVKNNTKGVGDLWSYDTALRIGFYLHVYPKNVYVQCGVKEGLKKMTENIPIKRFVDKSLLPKQLQSYDSYMIENFLCIYGSKSHQIKC